jgi:GxxExxY protein
MERELREIGEGITKRLGAGYSERIYQNALEIELRKRKYKYERERIILVKYDGEVIGNVRADVILWEENEPRMIVECKTVKSASGMMQQVRCYINMMKETEGKELKGVIMNFPTSMDASFEIFSC